MAPSARSSVPTWLEPWTENISFSVEFANVALKVNIIGLAMSLKAGNEVIALASTGKIDLGDIGLMSLNTIV